MRENKIFRHIGFDSLLLKDNDTDRYGIIFFDREEKLLGGVLLNQLFSSDDFDFVRKNKTSFKEISGVDKGAFILFENGKAVSCHYFKDGSYLKLFYKRADGEYVVSDMKLLKPSFDWLSKLETQDLELIKP